GGPAAVRRAAGVRAAGPAFSSESVSVGTLEDVSEPPMTSESDIIRSGFAPEVSLEPVSTETAGESPGIPVAAEPGEMRSVPAAEARFETVTVPSVEEPAEVPVAAEPGEMPSAPPLEASSGTVPAENGDDAVEVPVAARPETMPSVPAAETQAAAPSIPSSDDPSRESPRPSSVGRSGRRRETFAQEDRIAAVNGILDAVLSAAAAMEDVPAAIPKSGSGREREAVSSVAEPAPQPARDSVPAAPDREAREQTGPETRAGKTAGIAVEAGAVTADGTGETAFPTAEAAIPATVVSGRESASAEPGSPETGSDAANDVADTDTVEPKTELKDGPMPEVTVGSQDHAGIRVEDGIQATREEAVHSAPTADARKETAAAAVPELKRERFQTDVLIAGAGVAGLSTAIRLLQRVNRHNEAVAEGRLAAEKLEPPQVMVVDKGADIGSHVLSGAAVDPVSLRTLFPDFEKRGAPVDAWVGHNPFYYLTSRSAIRVPITPPGMGSKGCFITSLSRFTRWLGAEAESLGVQTAAGFAAVDWLEAGGAVAGLRLGDKGIDKHGRPRHNAMAGDEIEARVTVLAEGVHGTLTGRAVRAFGLDRESMPQAAVLAIKEIIELPEERPGPGTALHTFGYPHDASTYAGGFLYAGPGRHVTVGLATGLDYRDPLLDPHDLFVRWKSHPLLKKWIGGGKAVEYGAKTIPEGGYFSVPRLVADGLMIVGDAGGLLNSIRLKGIHLAVQSGIDAGDALFEAWKSGDFGKSRLEAYPKAFFRGWAGREMRRVRNLHQCYHGGQLAFMAGIGLHTATFGLLPAGRLRIKPDADSLTPLSKRPSRTRPFAFTPDALMPDKLSDVFLSGTVHEEDQPSHIAVLDPRVCAEKCKAEFDCPCTRFCPAQVYEWWEEEKRVRVNFTNCLHCQTCETKDPFRNISWKLPEGGGGPRYKGM
ncbi:MAG: 4Fe-4S dicluster domain-containing protein, partial [bacterium]|nr:4Fe-4S dicluster domain-containing protein [bacterium]